MEDKYKIIKVIATGGMATIYKAEQISLSRPVIIKKLHPHLAQDNELVRRFEREAQILGSLNHPNIVEVIDFYTENGDYYIVLEFIAGRSLKELIREVGNLPLPIANFIVCQIAAGLIAAHKKGILHRDIKPANIMISDDGKVKISDFGLALALEGTEITEPGATIGTPAYLPPELIRGEKATPRSDIYSLGILYYEIVTGANPFEGENRFDTINNILYKKLPSITFKDDAEQKSVAPIISRMTKQDPRLRYGTVDSLRGDLSSRESATQEHLVKFLENPTHADTVVIARKTSPSGTIIYGAVLVTAIIISSALILENRRIGHLYEKVRSFASYRYSAADTADVPVDTLTTAMLDSVPIEGGATGNNTTPNTGTTVPIPGSGSGFVKPLVKPWAEVYIDDEYCGSTPLSEPIQLSSGDHTITLKHPNRKEYSKLITISPDETLKVVATLEEVFGYLKISVSPWAEVYIDGEKKGVTPIAAPLRLSSGSHVLELKKDETIQWKNTIVIPMNDTLKKAIVLK
jgi:serine/threonine protein kinase